MPFITPANARRFLQLQGVTFSADSKAVWYAPDGRWYSVAWSSYENRWERNVAHVDAWIKKIAIAEYAEIFSPDNPHH
jgi:Na+-transporting NADH:ubiquinone oxidoreductase subunit NqrB